jgi:hypothetical protein
MSRKRDHGSEGSLDGFIKKEVGKALDEELENRGQDGVLLEDIQPDDPILKKILSSFPSSEGYYGKLYKVLSSGKEEMKYVFNALEEIGDPEVSVAELAKERKWGSGDYRLRVFKHGASGCQKSVRLSIGVDEPLIQGQSNQPPQESFSDKLKEFSDIVSTAKEIFPRAEPGTSEKMGQTLADTFKSGVDVVKEALGPGFSNSQDNVVKVIGALKDLGIFQKPESIKPVSETEIVERTIKNLKEMGVLISPKSEDATLDKLIKLRESGLIKLAGEDKEDALSLAGKLKPIIELVTSLGLGGGSPERATFWNSVAPHIPTFIEKLATPFREYLELRKMELQQGVKRVGGYIPVNRGPVRPIVTQGKPVVTGEEVSLGQKEEAPPQQIHPIAAEILNSIQSRDRNYFPRLKENLILFIGPHVPDALVTGQVSVEAFMSMVSSSPFGQLFNTLEARIYLQDFISWMKEIEVVKGNGAVIAKCNKCSHEFEFTKVEWEGEEDKSCDDCEGGILELVSPVSA